AGGCCSGAPGWCGWASVPGAATSAPTSTRRRATAARPNAGWPNMRRWRRRCVRRRATRCRMRRRPPERPGATHHTTTQRSIAMQDLTLDRAQALARDAIDRAVAEHGRPICVAVCDERGLLLAFARMDGAPARSVRIAQGKAYSAARMGVTTAAL